MAFMPFVTCGDPDMSTTIAVVRELASRGVDLIELGFPYSDPIADGPVIQASYTRALGRKFEISDIFTGVATLRGSIDVPLAAMVAFAIVFRIGPERFVEQARESGFAGLIVPDLPGDEADEMAQLCRRAGLDLIQLVAPTTPASRIARILKSASGFVYCVSVAGTTGVRTQLPAELKDQLRDLRTRTDLPLAVGFGVSKPEQVDELRGLADGVIVGSAIVRQMEALGAAGTDSKRVISDIGEFAGRMLAATRA
jgi:tryptophan synthase alpha chain